MIYLKNLLSGHCFVSETSVPGTIEIPKEDYDRYADPPANVRLAHVLLDPEKTASEKKLYMFRTLKHYLVDDGSLVEDEARPFHNPPMTVDEIQIEYQKYVGDDDERAEQLLQKKREAKAYIRSLVEG